MLVECPECKRQISDKAESCPNCGHPRNGPSTPELAIAIPKVEKSKGATPIFLVLSIIAFILMIGTPRFLLFFSMMATLGFAVTSLFRKEKARAGAIIILVLTAGLFVLMEMGGEGTSAEASENAVSYMVEGSATGASLTYSNGQGGTEQKKVSLPWDTSILSKSGDHLYISAQNEGDSGSITVHIIVNGKEFKRSDASGAYTIASASARCCK